VGPSKPTAHILVTFQVDCRGGVDGQLTAQPVVLRNREDMDWIDKEKHSIQTRRQVGCTVCTVQVYLERSVCPPGEGW
jgi:hypothetical protein